MIRKVGITGSNGFIGWHLCNILSLDIGKFEIIKFPRSCFDRNTEIDSYVNKCNIIIHLAGINRHGDQNYIYEKNIELANNLINSLTRTRFKGHLIYSSSIHENKESAFGRSKKNSRELLEEFSIKNNILFSGLLIPNVFGAFGVPYYNSVISTFCHQLVNNEIPIIQTDTTLNLIYINDLVKIIINLFKNESNETINIAYTDTFKLSEILYILNNFKSYVKYDDYTLPYLCFSPEIIMDKFEKIFLN